MATELVCVCSGGNGGAESGGNGASEAGALAAAEADAVQLRIELRDAGALPVDIRQRPGLLHVKVTEAGAQGAMHQSAAQLQGDLPSRKDNPASLKAPCTLVLGKLLMPIHSPAMTGSGVMCAGAQRAAAEEEGWAARAEAERLRRQLAEAANTSDLERQFKEVRAVKRLCALDEFWGLLMLVRLDQEAESLCCALQTDIFEHKGL